LPGKRRSRVTALVESEYTPRQAEAISKALEADNISNADVSVVTERRGNTVVTRVESVSPEKLLPVLDDLLFCQSIAEGTLKAARAQKSF
jgi:hypothetical protein